MREDFDTGASGRGTGLSGRWSRFRGRNSTGLRLGSRMDLKGVVGLVEGVGGRRGVDEDGDGWEVGVESGVTWLLAWDDEGRGRTCLGQ
jgi:hypothetical protein